MNWLDDSSMDDPAATTAPSLEELGALHGALTPSEREELLECLLIAAPGGGKAMLDVLETALFIFASEQLSTGDG